MRNFKLCHLTPSLPNLEIVLINFSNSDLICHSVLAQFWWLHVRKALASIILIIDLPWFLPLNVDISYKLAGTGRVVCTGRTGGHSAADHCHWWERWETCHWLSCNSWTSDWRHHTDGGCRLGAATVLGRVDLEPTTAQPAQSASISGTQSGPHPVIDGSHFLHKKCEKSLIDHGLKCPWLRESQASSHLTHRTLHTLTNELIRLVSATQWRVWSERIWPANERRMEHLVLIMARCLILTVW